MSDLLPPEATTAAAAGEQLSASFEVRQRGVEEAERIYYDTFDGLLHAAGMVASHEHGRLVLRELDGDGAERAALAWPTPPARALLVGTLAPGPLRSELAGLVDVRALLPLVRVRIRQHPLDVLDAERKTVLRIVLEEPALVLDDGAQRALSLRVRLAGVRGYDAARRRAQHKLERELGYMPAARPLLDEALGRAGRVAGGTSAKIDVALAPEGRADEAAAAVLTRLLEVIEANREGAIADLDSEFLHDFRVAVRRSRSLQRELRDAFPPPELAHFRAEFRWLQQATGEARDLDVYLLEFDEFRRLVPANMRADLDPLLAVLREHGARAHRELVSVLRSERFTTLVAAWSEFLQRLPSLPQTQRPQASRPIGELASERIRRVYARMVKMGVAIDAASPAEDYHELRKKGKELRYLLELLGAPLFDAEVVRQMIRALKSLQDALGRHQDREIQVDTLRSLRDDVAARPAGADALMAMGVLVQRLAADQRAARGEFAERFAAFASGEQRERVKDTFA